MGNGANHCRSPSPESTSIETQFTNPAPIPHRKARNVTAFHKPERCSRYSDPLLDGISPAFWLQIQMPKSNLWSRADRNPPQPQKNPSPPTNARSLTSRWPPAVMRPTPPSSFVYRLIKLAGARRVPSSCGNRGNLGDQTLKRVAVRHARRRPEVHRGFYSVRKLQRRAARPRQPASSPPSSAFTPAARSSFFLLNNRCRRAKSPRGAGWPGAQTVVRQLPRQMHCDQLSTRKMKKFCYVGLSGRKRTCLSVSRRAAADAHRKYM